MDKDLRQQLDSGVSAERLRHEQEQAHFNELHLLAPSGYFVVAFDGRILQANVAGAQLLGVPRAAVGGHRFRDFVRLSWREEFDIFFESAISSRAPRRQRIEMTCAEHGTGYASLAYLKRYDIDFVKIDPSLAQTLEGEDGELALYEAIVAMAHKLGLKVVAEGVETAAQRSLLRDAGCDYAQGYMFGHPMTAAELEQLAVG
jgi:PAS domain-containing protein